MPKVNLIGKIEKFSLFFPLYECAFVLTNPLSMLLWLQQFAAQLMYPIDQCECVHTIVKDTQFSNECIQFELDLS